MCSLAPIPWWNPTKMTIKEPLKTIQMHKEKKQIKKYNKIWKLESQWILNNLSAPKSWIQTGGGKIEETIQFTWKKP